MKHQSTIKFKPSSLIAHDVNATSLSDEPVCTSYNAVVDDSVVSSGHLKAFTSGMFLVKREQDPPLSIVLSFLHSTGIR